MNLSLIDIIGWVGALEVIAAYLLVSLHKVTGKSVVFQLLNLTGALLLIVNTMYLKAYPSAFVNVIWTGIALYSIIKNRKNIEH
jgi:hypothetical protein